jgi:hypothetical protein
VFHRDQEVGATLLEVEEKGRFACNASACTSSPSSSTRSSSWRSAASPAASRFEARRALIVEEANDIGTAWLRIDALPPAFFPGRKRPEGLEFIHFPILDCGIGNEASVLQLARDLTARRRTTTPRGAVSAAGHGKGDVVEQAMPAEGSGGTVRQKRCGL